MNIAARIESTARPNTIYLSAAVAKHLGPGALISLGTFRLRGVSEEMELFTSMAEEKGKRLVS